MNIYYTDRQRQSLTRHLHWIALHPVAVPICGWEQTPECWGQNHKCLPGRGTDPLVFAKLGDRPISVR